MDVVEKYIQQSVDVIMRMNPSLDRNTVRKLVEEKARSCVKNPTLYVDNEIEGKSRTLNLIGICKWIDDTNPVISGNATFYKQPSELASPTSNMLRSLKKERKEVKKAMFKHKSGSDEYRSLDLDQQNKKVIVNADFGGSGNKNAAFYNKYTPASTTLMAQSIITTMAAFFEGFVGDNHKFYSDNECFDWINTVIKKNEEIPSWVKIPSKHDVAYRIKMHFIKLNNDISNSVSRFIDNCDEKELVYLYYANNIKDFITNHKNIQKLILDVLEALPNYEVALDKVPNGFMDKITVNDGEDPVEKYNSWMSNQMFLNPNSIPKCIEDPMNELIKWMTQFIYVEYITADSIAKLNNHKRNTVLLVDTDSNIINSNLFVSFVIDEVLKGKTFGREKIYNEMILINVLSAILAEVIAKMLDYYGRRHNMDEKSRSEFVMKNEFMFRRFFLMKTKKRYAASIVLREGNIMIPFKPEIKGMDFIKAGVSDYVTDNFKNILQNNILYPDEVQLHKMMDDLKKFEAHVYDDLKHGSTKYLKQSQFKSIDGYNDKKKAKSLPVYRGTYVWNLFNPDNQIYSLDRVCIIKTIISSEKDLDKLSDKKVYDVVVKSNLFKSIKGDKPIGLQYICVPQNIQKIPDWILSILDYDITVSDVLSSFKSILESLNIEPVEFKTPNGTASFPSALLNL